MPDAVLQAIVLAAVEATAAGQGWLVRAMADRLEVVAAAGGGTTRLLGASVPVGSGSAGFVIESGQPLAMAHRGDDPRLGEGIAATLGRPPASVLSVPCATADAVLGALELVDKGGASMFSFDDIELATLLAGVAGAALAGAGGAAPTVPDPAQLGRDLQRLASTDPARYAGVATAIGALLAQ